ncbi:MAG: NAD(P)H-hydrate dehydratase [Gemmatimonadales bacterium]
MLLPVLSPEQSADWDSRSESAGIPLETLMECAGRAAACVMVDRQAERVRQGVLVACGTGNNGGDGWVVARALHRAGLPVWVAALPGEQSPLCRRVSTRARAEGVRVVAPDGPWPNVGLVVDALLGTGARGAPRPPMDALVARLADLALPIVAIDGPTGLDLSTGMSYGSPRAVLSITFGGLRRGHLLAREDAGEVVVVDIGHAPPDPSWPVLLTDDVAAAWQPPLHAEDHKGVRGRVVVIGGNAGMTGAIRMASRAAFAAGAGLVFAVAPESTVSALVAAEPDLQTRVHPLQLPVSDDLASLLRQADAVVIGPGLGRGDGKREFVLALLELARRAVIDADALTSLQGSVEALAPLAADRSLVLTPHPGEFRTLFPDLGGVQEHDPWSAAARAADACGATVLLKGVPTVVARKGTTTLTLAAGNPGLATGGSGDVLSGLVGALLGTGLAPERSAALGAQMLGGAADAGARRLTARALRPMDVIASLPDVWRAWEVLRVSPPVARPPVLLDLEVPELV